MLASDADLALRPEGLSLDAHEVMQIISNAAATHERMPMLDIVFDKMVRRLTESFLHMMSTDVRVSLDGVVSVRFSDFFIEQALSPGIIGVIRAKAWDNSFLIVADRNLIFALAEVMLGGAPESISEDTSMRQLTAIEVQLATRIINVMAQRLAEAFEVVDKTSFEIERVEMNAQFAAIARGSSAAVRGDLLLEVGPVSGHVQIVFPYATLDPIKPLLLQMFMGERLGKDAAWEGHFEAALRQTSLGFEAILHQEVAMLRDILAWKKGSVIAFDAPADADVRLVCGEFEFFRGRMGSKNGKIAVQIDEVRLGPPSPDLNAGERR